MARSKTCDVFVSHSPQDTALAANIADAFRASGLDAVTLDDIRLGENVSDRLWDALAESRAVVVVVPQSGPTPAMAIEIGAAMAWNKPIVGVVAEEAASHLPHNLPPMPLFTPGRIDEVIHLVKRSGEQLSSVDILELKSLYSAMGLPVDRYALEASTLTELTKQFRKRTGKSISGERLLSELLRLRKQGHLPRTTSKTRQNGRKPRHVDAPRSKSAG